MVNEKQKVTMEHAVAKIKPFVITKSFFSSFVFFWCDFECFRTKCKFVKAIQLNCHSLSCIREWQKYWFENQRLILTRTKGH